MATNCETAADNIGPSCTLNAALRDCSKASLRRLKVTIIIDNCCKKKKKQDLVSSFSHVWKEVGRR